MGLLKLTTLNKAELKTSYQYLAFFVQLWRLISSLQQSTGNVQHRTVHHQHYKHQENETINAENYSERKNNS